MNSRVTRLGFLLCVLLAFPMLASGQNPPKKEKLHHIYPPAIDAAAAGTKAIEMFDANKDGKISGAELDKCPGLKAAIDQIDKTGKGEITAEKIAARIKAWQDSKLGRMSLGCRLTHNGQPLAGAEVKFVPEKFLGLGDAPKWIASGKTDQNGMVMLTVPLPPEMVTVPVAFAPLVSLALHAMEPL